MRCRAGFRVSGSWFKAVRTKMIYARLTYSEDFGDSFMRGCIIWGFIVRIESWGCLILYMFMDFNGTPSPNPPKSEFAGKVSNRPLK